MHWSICRILYCRTCKFCLSFLLCPFVWNMNFGSAQSFSGGMFTLWLSVLYWKCQYDDVKNDWHLWVVFIHITSANMPPCLLYLAAENWTFLACQSCDVVTKWWWCCQEWRVQRQRSIDGQWPTLGRLVVTNWTISTTENFWPSNHPQKNISLLTTKIQ